MMLAYFIAYFLLTFLLPSYRAYKKTGINPVTFGKTDNAHNLIGFYMKLVMLLILLSALETDSIIALSLQTLFNHPALSNAGLACMLLSLIWIIIAQVQLEASWRIGIDENHKTELKTQGLYRLSRNPIFLGMILSQLGFFLYHSTYLNLIILILAWVLISIQIRLEEEFLERQHGEMYLTFKSATSRWLF